MTTKWSGNDIQRLVEAYSNGDAVDLVEMAALFGRSKAALACKASELKLCAPRGGHKRTAAAIANCTTAQRKRISDSPELRRVYSERMLAWHANNEHPKGMRGKNHSDAAKKAISAAQKGREVPIDRTIKALKTKFRKYGYLSTPIKRGSWRAAWHDIGGKRKFYRSKWEANYARYLEWQKAHGIISDWSHESEVFWFEGIKRGCVSYLPDFRVITTAGVVEFHEVKGWMDARSKTKIRRMAKYHPDVVLKVFDAAWYRSNAPKLKRLVPGWQ